MPVGAFGGPRRIMTRLAPDGDTYQAGTLSGNPVAMASGIATLDVLEAENGWEKLEALGAQLERLLQPVLRAAPFPAAPGARGLALLAVAARERRAAHGGTLPPEARPASRRSSTPCWPRASTCRLRPTRPASSPSPIRAADLERLAQALRQRTRHWPIGGGG